MKKVIHFNIIAVILAFMASQMTEVYAAKAFVGKTGQTAISTPGDDGDWQAGVARKDHDLRIMEMALSRTN